MPTAVTVKCETTDPWGILLDTKTAKLLEVDIPVCIEFVIKSMVPGGQFLGII